MTTHAFGLRHGSRDEAVLSGEQRRSTSAWRRSNPMTNPSLTAGLTTTEMVDSVKRLYDGYAGRDIDRLRGAPLRNRTVDLLLTMETLCRLS